MKRLLLILCLALVPVAAGADELEKYMEMMRTDMRAAKVELLTDELKMSDAQATAFWPIQREYEVELAKVQDARYAMIKDYAKAYSVMDDATAKSLMDRAFKLQEQRTALLKKYSGKVSKQVSPQVGARFAHTESFVQSLIDLKIRGEVPVMQ